MLYRSLLTTAVAIAAAAATAPAATAAPRATNAQSEPIAAGLTANDRLAQIGPEGRALAELVGTWDANFTSWDKPGAAPVTTTGLVAEREMIGPMLQERLHTVPGSPGPQWIRVDNLTFNRTEGRWDYISMDTRAAAGIMSAWSIDRDPANHILVSFQPFALAVGGETAIGQLTHMEEIIIVKDADHVVKDQYFTMADGTGVKWLAKRYSYTRRK